MYKRVLLVISHLFLLISLATAQKNIVHVDQVTGTASITIPLYTLSAAHVSLPISVTYNANGIRAHDVESSAGMGWNLHAGGAISRTLRGLPDDVKKDMTGNDRLGWLYAGTGSSISNFTFANDQNTSTYTDVASDMNIINSSFGYADTEPDIFQVSAPGLNYQLVYDNVNSTFRTIPYKDVKIDYTTSTVQGPAFGEIISFTITNDEGIVYTFSALETTTQKVVSPVSNPKYFKTQYNQYLNGITYTSAWNLTKIQDPYNNIINLTYREDGKKGHTTPLVLTFPIAPVQTGGVTRLTSDSLQYALTGGTTPQLLSDISYSDGVTTSAFILSWAGTPSTSKSVIASIKGFGHNFSFNYDNVTSAGTQGFLRSFLRNVADGDCTSPFNYSFSYNGQREVPFVGYVTELPDSLSQTPTDNYGYVSSNVTAGTLTQVKYADGGSASFSFEPNNYYSPDSSKTINGSGIRIKQVLYSDGINAASNIVKNYSYLNPASGVSSGKPISLPVVSFIRPYGGNVSSADLLRYSTVSSSSDLSEDDHTVVYQYVTESQPGTGSTLYEFAVPGTSWDNITTPLPWSPTIINAGSPTTALTGLLKNTVNTYPFPPNPNYDFERGLLLKASTYDNNKNQVSEVAYSYQNSGAPITINALKYDVNSYGVGYSKYNIYTTTGPLTSQVTNKVFDIPFTSLFQQNTTNYSYNTTQQKLIQQSVVNSDGSTTTTNFVYAKDYNTTNASDIAAQSIRTLQQLNINSPVEQYTQFTPAGSTQARTISASLVKFNNSWPVYAGNMVLPAIKMSFTAPDGVTDFSPSSANTGNFINDSRYVTVENDLGYDFSGNLLSKDDGFRNPRTILTDHNFYKTAATFLNARFDEIAISDFDSRLTGFNFDLSGGAITSTSRTGQYAWSIGAGQTISKTISRNANAQNYVFSIWINSGAAGQINVTVTGGGVTNTKTINYGATTGSPTGWQYYEVKLPITNISSPTIAINAVSNQNVIIDDVLVYPDVATAATYAYDPITRTMTAETNTNGVSAYYTYDQLGRLHYSYDQDKNIILRKQYVLGNNVQNISTAFNISGPASGSIGVPAAFSVVNTFIPCVVADVSYTWNFGDGSATTSGVSAVHTFTTGGTYTVTLTASSPVYGVVSKTSTITITGLTTTKINYVNTTQRGVASDKTLSIIESISFLQGTTVVYNFSEADLISGVTIAPGAYTINVKASGPLYKDSTGFGYSAIVYTGSSGTGQCKPYNKTNTGAYTFSDDVSNTPQIYFFIQNLGCGQ